MGLIFDLCHCRWLAHLFACVVESKSGWFWCLLVANLAYRSVPIASALSTIIKACGGNKYVLRINAWGSTYTFQAALLLYHCQSSQKWKSLVKRMGFPMPRNYITHGFFLFFIKIIYCTSYRNIVIIGILVRELLELLVFSFPPTNLINVCKRIYTGI